MTELPGDVPNFSCMSAAACVASAGSYLYRIMPEENRTLSRASKPFRRVHAHRGSVMLARRGFLHLAAGIVALPAVFRIASAQTYPKLNAEINAALADPAIKARLVELGGTASITTPAEFARFIADEAEKWAKVVKFAGAKPE